MITLFLWIEKARLVSINSCVMNHFNRQLTFNDYNIGSEKSERYEMMKNYGLNYNQYGYRNFVIWLLSVLLLSMILSVPVKNIMSQTNESQLIIELDKRRTVVLSSKDNSTEDENNSVKRTIPEQKMPKGVSLKETPVAKTDQNIKLNDDQSYVVKSPDSDLTTSIEATLPKSDEIINSAFNNRKNLHVGQDFQIKPQDTNDFITKKVIAPKWNTMTQWVDEEVDKPSVNMKFYSEGIVGATERFFDRITIKKTFKTRYGTKVQCALIGLIAVCGWK